MEIYISGKFTHIKTKAVSLLPFNSTCLNSYTMLPVNQVAIPLLLMSVLQLPIFFVQALQVKYDQLGVWNIPPRQLCFKSLPHPRPYLKFSI